MGGRITAGQCRAARALLGWSQKVLAAKANITDRTVVDFENEQRVPRRNNMKAIQEALEGGGISFCDHGGVRPARKSDNP